MYGSPKKSGVHTHDPAPLRSLQIAFAPQGDGLQGCLGSSFMCTIIANFKLTFVLTFQVRKQLKYVIVFFLLEILVSVVTVS